MNGWKNKFIELFESGNLPEADILKRSHFPKSFFKYRTLNQYTLNSLIDSEVFLADLTVLNDPYEFAYSVNPIEVLRSQFKDPQFLTKFRANYKIDFPQAFLDEVLKDKAPFHKYIECSRRLNKNNNVDPDDITRKKEIEYQELINKQRQEVAVCCFTTRNDSILMWSHYAAQHQGICIEYDFNHDVDLILRMQPVLYADLQYDITNLLLPNFSTDRILLGTYLAALSKAKDWQYEDEWRLIKNNGSTNHAVPKPKAIYVGTRFSKNEPKTQEQLLEIAKKINVPVFKMTLDNSKYSIIPDPQQL